jgi:hypothetical protein
MRVPPGLLTNQRQYAHRFIVYKKLGIASLRVRNHFLPLGFVYHLCDARQFAMSIERTGDPIAHIKSLFIPERKIRNVLKQMYRTHCRDFHWSPVGDYFIRLSLTDKLRSRQRFGNPQIWRIASMSIPQQFRQTILK